MLYAVQPCLAQDIERQQETGIAGNDTAENVLPYAGDNALYLPGDTAFFPRLYNPMPYYTGSWQLHSGLNAQLSTSGRLRQTFAPRRGHRHARRLPLRRLADTKTQPGRRHKFGNPRLGRHKAAQCRTDRRGSLQSERFHECLRIRKQKPAGRQATQDTPIPVLRARQVGRRGRFQPRQERIRTIRLRARKFLLK